MGELSIDYKMDGHLYNLATFKDLYRLTRDQEVIYVGFKGEDTINNIIGSLCSYILDVEHKKEYRSISFSDDEWAKRTDIYASISYVRNGEIKSIKDKIDFISGEMKGGYASSSLIREYEMFSYNAKTLEELEEKIPKGKAMTITELKGHLNSQLRKKSEDN